MLSTVDIAWLKSIGIPYKEFGGKYLKLGELLVAHKDAVLAISQHVSNAADVLRAARGILKNHADLEALVEIAKAAARKEAAQYILEYGIPTFPFLFKSSSDIRTVGLLMVEIDKAAQPQSERVFETGLLSVKNAGLIKRITDLEVLTEIARRMKRYTLDVFEYALPAVAPLIESTADLRKIGLILSELAQLGGDEYALQFFVNKQLVEWYALERLTGRTPSQEEVLAKFKIKKPQRLFGF